MKRILLFIILIFSSYTLNSFAQTRLSGGQAYGWIDISDNIPGTPGLSDVYFISDNEGWITSTSLSYPEIYHTTDGGETFEVQTTQYVCLAIHMIDANEGYAGGTNGRVYRTTDGGANWNAIGSIGVTLTDLTFPPTGDTGYACGLNGAIYSITSSGVSPMTSGINGDLDDLSFPETSSYGKVCGGGIIQTYANGIWGGGNNSYPSGNYNGLHMFDNSSGWAAGSKIIHTSDGENWFEQTNPDPYPGGRGMNDIFFLNNNEGWIAGEFGLILHTTNGGIDWIVEGDGLVTAFLTGVHFTSSTNGYISGNDRTLLKYGEITSVENEEELPTEFSLYQNFPNPFNPNTKIKFTIPELRFTVLKVYDVLGNEVATLVDEYKSAGSYEIEFNSHSGLSGIKELSSGIYFYQLRIIGPEINSGQGMIQTRKMLLLK